MAFILDENYYTTLKSDLDDFLESSEANAVMLCDRGGNIIVHTGESVDDAVDIISALVAGAFAATKELAKVLGEEEFTAIFHQGVNTSIFISAVGEEVLLLALFDTGTTAGLVKMYALNAVNKIKGIFADILSGNQTEPSEPTSSFVLTKGPIFSETDTGEEESKDKL